ncbi:MAG: hypothetical protein A2W93_05255 [Bacteroidetes bacterium GWF2_43_63]|nr:MAG: hypothetical protein A2W94_11895 [Bacteroidetes bacterium GWE2_42_42]OFY56281.1 MAG: hypothetical protein A2W93_05255 [Bacteroidetes bacterium GWF2_43_63]HBG71960.1 hypothetical protein [Bacteroidales bacterium]HCB61861.1 hypothetical protein [Bacteroidales bacterium]HCY23883.1 hypothetical protein [Bacteroidales bacterium]
MMLAAEILYCLAIVAVMTLLILKWRPFFLPGIKKRWVLAAFYLKVIAGLGLTFIYTSYYSGRNDADIFRYFDDSKVMYDVLKTSPSDYFTMLSGINDDNQRFFDDYYSKMDNWYLKYQTVMYNDTHTIIRINAFIRLFSFGFFQVHNIIFIILGFIGLLALFKTFIKYFSTKALALYAAVFLIPSVVFWSSGILKESILIFAMGIFLYSYQQLLFISFNVFRVLLLLFSLVLMYFTKTYVLAVMLPVVIANTWIVLTNNRHAFAKQLISLLVFINLAVLAGNINADFNVFQLITNKLHDFVNLALYSNAGSMIDPIPLEPNFLSFLQYSPNAVINTLFRPFPADINTMIMVPVLIENIVIVVTLLLAVIFHERKVQNARILFFCLFFVIVLSVITGLTTPVLGALARYRIPLLPFLFIMLFLLIDFNKIALLLKIKKVVE